MRRGEGGNEVRLVFADLSNEPSFVLFTANDVDFLADLASLTERVAA